jgi:hypothetical protein
MAISDKDAYKLHYENQNRLLTDDETICFFEWANDKVHALYDVMDNSDVIITRCAHEFTSTEIEVLFDAHQACNCCERHLGNRPAELHSRRTESIIGRAPIIEGCNCSCRDHLVYLRSAAENQLPDEEEIEEGHTIIQWSDVLLAIQEMNETHEI